MPRLGNQILVVNKYITHADLDTPDSLTVATGTYLSHTYIYQYIYDHYTHQ